MDTLTRIVVTINSYLSDYVLLILLLGLGLWFSFKTGFVQIRCFKEGMKRFFGELSLRGGAQKSGMTSFQALAAAIAAQVGTGNIVGASGAILTGGPGAIFWMWIIAFFGMATIYAEAVLAQKTRIKSKSGEVLGGPVYYITTAFKGGFGKFLAGFFAVAIILALGFFGCMVQANSIGSTFESAFGVPSWIIGIVLVLICGFIFLGGDVKNFSRSFAQVSVPSVLVTQDASQLGFANLSSFCTDDYAGAAEAVRTLLAYGHRKIGILGGYMSYNGEGITSPRLAGAADVLQEHGIPFDPEEDFTPSRFSFPDSHQAARKMLEKHPGITAVFTHSDVLSVGVLRAAADLHLRVPEDLSIIGYDGIEYTDYSLPRLATVRQNTDALARRSVEDLLFRICCGREAVHEKIPFSVDIKESISHHTETDGTE